MNRDIIDKIILKAVKKSREKYGYIFDLGFSGELIPFCSDKLRLQLISEYDLNDDDDRIYNKLVDSLSSDKSKIEALDIIKDESVRLSVIAAIKSDEFKEQFLTGYHPEGLYGYEREISNIICSFSSDKLKLRFFDKVRNRDYKMNIINGLSSEENKKIINKFLNSNSQELSKLSDKMLPLIFSSSDPLKSAEEIEKIFLKNNIPMVGKVFLCFQKLYPELNEFGFSSKIMSPELCTPSQTKQMQAVNRNIPLSTKETDVRFQIIFNDLLRIAMRSNNRSLREYISDIEKGNILFMSLSNGIIEYNSLDDKAQKTLDIFSEHLQVLYEKMHPRSEEVLEGLSPEEKIAYFSQKFKTTKRYDLPDRIIRSFAYQAGFENFEQFKNVMINSVKEKEEISRKRSEELSRGKRLFLEKGDFIRGTGGIKAFESALNNGNVCNEYLGTFTGESRSDKTPLDTDWSICSEPVNIHAKVKEYQGIFSYGDIYYIIKKDNPNIKITRDSDGNLIDTPYEPDKVEMFRTIQFDQFGARTGTASSDIDYIALDTSSKTMTEYQIALAKNEIVKNGFYIPVVDMYGNLIFLAQEYDKLKEKMLGLSYYGSEEYHLKEHSESQYVNDIRALMPSNDMLTKAQSDMVYQAIRKAIEGIVIDENGTRMVAKDKIGKDITGGSIEVLETGSSVRGTNIPYDYDFDYIFRIDSEWLNDPKKNKYLHEQLCKNLHISEVPSGDFREVVANIPGMGKVNLDITFVKKTDKVEYSTEMSLMDRLDTMDKIDPGMKNEVAANIILAKILFKTEGCYKSQRKDSSQGGLGGVGIENWIVQNGGTLESAAKSFLEASEGKSFEEFKKSYHIHDYGKNHMFEKKEFYPYDEFVHCNMNELGYIKMQNAMKKYLLYLKGEKKVLPKVDSIIEKLKKQKDINDKYLQQQNEYLQQQQEPLQEEEEVHRSRGYITFGITMIISLIMSILTILSCILLK